MNKKASDSWTNNGHSEQIKDRFLDYLDVEASKIIFADHHTCHAYAGYYGFVPQHLRQLPFVVLTLDGEGDGVCATVSVVRDGTWERISETKSGNSIASFYGAITKFLKMRVNEHEYKVMGMAPYCSEYNRDRTLKKFNGLFKINDDLTFTSVGGGNYITRWLEKNLTDDRFDGVSAAAQKYVEDMAVEWLTKVIAKTGINNIVLSGGFFMNIKVNKEIMEMPEVNNLIVCPSGGDESTSLGAVYYGAESLGIDIQKDTEIVKNLYLGSDLFEDDIEKSLKEYSDNKEYSI
jgi:carbamoyltransferase